MDEMHCLCAVFSENPPSAKRLSELINVNPTRASKILRGLERKAFVSRTMHTVDRRKEQVILTETGTKAAEAILSMFAEVGSELLGSWRKEISTDFAWLLRTAVNTQKVHTSV